MGGILGKRSRGLIGLLLSAVMVAACASTGKIKDKEARYQPAENLLDILADFQRHLEDDTYRYDTARDITGKNIYKATLIRLDNYEKAYPNKMTAIIYYSRAKALERLHDYEGAIQNYHQVARVESKLQQPAEKNLQICQGLQSAQALPPIHGNGDPQEQLLEFSKRVARWHELVEKYAGTPYESLAREEEERVEQGKIRFLLSFRGAIVNGNALVILAYQELINRHDQSKNIDRHLLDLADFYVFLSQEYLQVNDPERPDFNLATFRQYTDSALQLYGVIAKERHGKMERVEAKGRLMALKAFVNRVTTLAQ